MARDLSTNPELRASLAAAEREAAELRASLAVAERKTAELRARVVADTSATAAMKGRGEVRDQDARLDAAQEAQAGPPRGASAPGGGSMACVTAEGAPDQTAIPVQTEALQDLLAWANDPEGLGDRSRVGPVTQGVDVGRDEELDEEQEDREEREQFKLILTWRGWAQRLSWTDQGGMHRVRRVRTAMLLARRAARFRSDDDSFSGGTAVDAGWYAGHGQLYLAAYNGEEDDVRALLRALEGEQVEQEQGWLLPVLARLLRVYLRLTPPGNPPAEELREIRDPPTDSQQALIRLQVLDQRASQSQDPERKQALRRYLLTKFQSLDVADFDFDI